MVIDLIPFNSTAFEQRMETLAWRNAPDVACWFKIPHIDEETHRRWLRSMEEARPRGRAFFISADGTYVGVTYFHSINDAEGTADWGIYLRGDAIRGKGVGRKAMQLALGYAERILHLRRLMLDVHRDNARALRLYESMGFRRIPNTEGVFLRYVRDLTPKEG